MPERRDLASEQVDRVGIGEIILAGVVLILCVGILLALVYGFIKLIKWAWFN